MMIHERTNAGSIGAMFVIPGDDPTYWDDIETGCARHGPSVASPAHRALEPAAGDRG